MSAPRHEPTPAEIEREAAAIRAEWDEQTEHDRRAGGFQRVEWTIPGSHSNCETVDADTLHGFAGPN